METLIFLVQCLFSRSACTSPNTTARLFKVGSYETQRTDLKAALGNLRDCCNSSNNRALICAPIFKLDLGEEEEGLRKNTNLQVIKSGSFQSLNWFEQFFSLEKSKNYCLANRETAFLREAVCISLDGVIVNHQKWRIRFVTSTNLGR